MATTLYGLNNCDTCKKARKWLERFETAHGFVDYRDNRQTPETLIRRPAAGTAPRSVTTWPSVNNLPSLANIVWRAGENRRLAGGLTSLAASLPMLVRWVSHATRMRGT